MSAIPLVPFIFFSAAAVLGGLALVISPKTSIFKKTLKNFAQREDGITTYLPLLASLSVSFILTIVLKLIQG